MSDSQIQTSAGSSGSFLGFPLEGFGLFTSLLLTICSGLFALCISMVFSIFGLLIWNQLLHHKVNYANTYLYVGFPAAIAVWAIALVIFGTLWIRAKIRA